MQTGATCWPENDLGGSEGPALSEEGRDGKTTEAEMDSWWPGRRAGLGVGARVSAQLQSCIWTAWWVPGATGDQMHRTPQAWLRRQPPGLGMLLKSPKWNQQQNRGEGDGMLCAALRLPVSPQLFQNKTLKKIRLWLQQT